MFAFDCNIDGGELGIHSDKGLETITNTFELLQNYCAGFSKYANEFTIPYLLATIYFNGVEQKRLLDKSPLESFQAYMDLLEFNMNIFSRGFQSSIRAISNYSQMEMQNATAALMNTIFPFIKSDGENICEFIGRQSELLKMLSDEYPQAIRDIEPEYGFHFERGDHELVAETDRFYLYQVAPVDKKVKTDPSKKPIIIIPPFVLGANILGFLPHENRSYAHCFANLEIPTYIRIMKDIRTTEAMQVMTAEDDCMDTKYFCEKIVERNGKPVTLNGYCQGGYMAVCDYLTGELDDYVDAIVTCVSPMDGTRSDGLAKFLISLPQRFNDLAYGTKTLPSGNKVADGNLMGWVYKLKSIEHESPIVAYYRDLMMFGRLSKSRKPQVSKVAAAINYWLNFERTDLPLSITKMSFDSYNVPVTEDGVLPVRMFDRELNFKRIQEKGVKWLICYGIKDDLVEKNTALAPLDFVDAEVSAFPKGHVAIATSWSLPTSECSLHSCFGDNYRGPVRFHLDLDEEIDGSASATVQVLEAEEEAGSSEGLSEELAETAASLEEASAEETAAEEETLEEATEEDEAEDTDAQGIAEDEGKKAKGKKTSGKKIAAKKASAKKIEAKGKADPEKGRGRKLKAKSAKSKS